MTPSAFPVQVGVVPASQLTATELGIDGVIGWPAIKANVLAFDLHDEAAPVAVLSAARAGAGSVEFNVTAEDILELEFASGGAAEPQVLIDTGSDLGVMLSPAAWRTWKQAHPDAPRTIQTVFLFAEGFHAQELAWADEIRIGELVLHHVPVSEAGISYTSRAANHRDVVAFGLAALRRMLLVVDAENKRAFAVADDRPTPTPEHNRLGVTFVPVAGDRSTLAAAVAPRSPAAEADIRDGDVLLTLDGRPAATWWDDPHSSVPAQTKVRFELRRGSTVITRDVIARDIFPSS